MREIWELPGPSMQQRLIRGVMAVALVWALVAVPLTLWLAVRERPAPPPPPDRALSVMEQSAVTSAIDELSTGFVRVVHQVHTPSTRFDVTETVQTDTGDAVGTVTSGSQTAELLVAGGTTYLRGGSAFWSTFGVPTSFGGWVVVDGMLGELAFPLAEVVDDLALSPDARVQTPEAGAEELVYESGEATAVFTPDGVIDITAGERSARVEGNAADASAQLNAGRADSAVAGRLEGVSGAMTVTEPLPPPPPEGVPAP